MWASSDISMELLRLSLSLSSERAVTEPVTPPPPPPAKLPDDTPLMMAAAGPLGDDVRGGESQEDQLFGLSSESEGEMLSLPVVLEKGKKLGPLIPI